MDQTTALAGVETRDLAPSGRDFLEGFVTETAHSDEVGRGFRAKPAACTD
jgi:hypothetical protein